jgi:hypothetical protein
VRVREVNVRAIRRAAHTAAALLLLLEGGATARAQEGDQIGFTTYYFTDSGDNSVLTTSFRLAKRLLQATVFMIDIELDNITVPPVTAVTGATRPQRRKAEPFEKSRGQVIAGVEHGITPLTTLAGNVYRSQEVDYTSTAYIGTLSQELFDRNMTLTVRGQMNIDRVGEILEDGSLTTRPKDQFTGQVSVAQILTPTTVLDLSYDLVLASGFQSDPYRQVRVYDTDGTQTLTDELHPDTRGRHAGTFRLSQLVPTIGASLIGSYRFYTDTWNVTSHTGEVKFNKYIFRDLIFGVDYRYYTQSASFFTLDRYVGAEYLADAYRTADYKLKRFSSNNFGLSLSFLLRGLAGSSGDLGFLEQSAIEVLYFRYFNDLEFSADILQASLRFSI